jgi:hypothetical protein
LTVDEQVETRMTQVRHMGHSSTATKISSKSNEDFLRAHTRMMSAGFVYHGVLLMEDKEIRDFSVES